MMKTKVRGLKRKCRNMVRRLEEETESFPRSPCDCAYWHLHLPVAQKLIDSSATPFGVRRLCVQTLIRRAHHLANNAPVGQEVRVVAAVTLPEMWASQIIVFFGPAYFRDFFNRNDEFQKWTPVASKLSKQFDVALPSGFSEQGFIDETRDEGHFHHARIWFAGQMGNS